MAVFYNLSNVPKTLRKHNGTKRADLIIRHERTIEQARLRQAIRTDDTISMRIKSTEKIDFTISDYINFSAYGISSKYKLNFLPKVKKVNSRLFQYDCEFQGEMYELEKVNFLDTDAEEMNFDLTFTLVGDAEFYLKVLINNLERLSSGWDFELKLDPQELIRFGEVKSLGFDNENCLEVLQKLCEAYDCEFWIENKMIYFGWISSPTDILLQYGKGKGLYSLEREENRESRLINTLYVQGGSRNLPIGYRNYSRYLKLPNGEDKIYQNNLINRYGVIEGSVSFPDLFPSRVGTVTGVDDEVSFIDSNMDFDLNETDSNGNTKYLIQGQDAVVYFNSGNLAGYEFAISEYDHDEKKFVLNKFQDDNDNEFPQEDAPFNIQTGDKYVILNIRLPQSYIDNAENQLEYQAQQYFNQVNVNRAGYKLFVTSSYLEEKEESIKIGDRVEVIDKDLEIYKTNARITEAVYDLLKPFEVKFELEGNIKISKFSGFKIDMMQSTMIGKITENNTVNKNISRLKAYQLKRQILDSDGNIRKSVISNEIIKGEIIDDEETSTDKTWSSEKIDNKFNHHGLNKTTQIDNTTEVKLVGDEVFKELDQKDFIQLWHLDKLDFDDLEDLTIPNYAESLENQLDFDVN